MAPSHWDESTGAGRRRLRRSLSHQPRKEEQQPRAARVGVEMMDPYQNQRKQLTPGRNTDPRDNQPDVPGGEQTDDVDRYAAAGRNQQQQQDRQPRYSDGFTVIAPNESRRSEIKKIAQREEDKLQRWKETHRVTSVHVTPEKLGGDLKMAEAREKQHTNRPTSRLQKKLKQEELEKKRRQEADEALQKMKDEQRQKAERLEEKNRQEERRRREQFGQDRIRKADRLQQRFESTAPRHTSPRSEAVENNQRDMPEKSVIDVQLDQKRVNSAFLDKLEARGRGSVSTVKTEEERPRLAPDRPSTATEQDQLARLEPDPDPSFSAWTEEADPKSDYDWALMKLMNKFSHCSKDFLEDVLVQCNGDYEQACALLV